MSDIGENVTEPVVEPAVDVYEVAVTVLTPTVKTVYVPKEDFLAGYGPTARANVESRLDSLMTGFVLSHQDTLLPDVDADAQVVRVDVVK